MARVRAHLCLVILCVSVASLLPAIPFSQASGISADEPEWTVMMYMAADSEPALPWEEDINEMETARLTDWMNVIVLVDPLGSGDSKILEIASDGGMDTDILSPEIDDHEEVIPADGEVNMASPYTLSDFITYTAREYPADRLALFLWGHGGGWHGLCQDGLYVLQLPDLGYALDLATEELGRKLDIIISDSCVEGVLETMYELREHADWYVGSEISVPAQGFRYDLVLDSLADDRDIAPESWGAAICGIHRMTLVLESWSATIATYDLRALDGFVDQLGELSGFMQGYAGLYRDSLMQALQQAATSDLTEWYLDTGDALRRLVDADVPLEVRFLALEALLAYDALIYEFEMYASPYDGNYEDVADCTGAAVYAPSDDDSDDPYWLLSFSESGWGNATVAIRTDEPEITGAPGPEVSYADTDEDGELDEAALHWDIGHEHQMAWVFAQTYAGVQLLDVLESNGSDLVVTGMSGELIVSASAWDGGSAASHDSLNLVLTRSLDIRVAVVSSDGIVTEGIEVVVMTDHGPVGLSLSEDTFIGAVTVPGDADYGDLLSVEVLGNDGATIARNWTYVIGTEMVLEVAVVTDDERLPAVEFIMPMALITLCAVALVLYLRGRKEPPSDGS